MPQLERVALADDEWETLLTPDDAHPTGSVTVGDHGTVVLDLTAIVDG